MVFFNRGNWGYNPYKSWGSTRYSKNGVKRRAVQSIRAANNQNSTINFAFKINYAFTASYSDATKKGTAAINIYDVLQSSENFINMKNMYDTVKVNGVNVRLNVTDYTTTAAEASTVKAINVVTAWDKSGLSTEEIEFYNSNSDVITDDKYDEDKAVAYVNKIGSKVAGYGSVKKGLLNNYQRFSRYEKCWPTTQQEKALYIPTRMFNNFSTGQNASSSLISISGDYTEDTVNDVLSNPNPCIPFENVAVPWKPTLLVGVFKTKINGSAVSQYADCEPVVFNAEFTIPCTFKGLKGDN